MSYIDGNITDTQRQAGEAMQRLIRELQSGIFSAAKLDLAYTNPDEFLEEFLNRVPEDVRPEVKGIMKHTIITGFFRMTAKRARAEKAQEN